VSDTIVDAEVYVVADMEQSSRYNTFQKIERMEEVTEKLVTVSK
jgi:hypothetical protein